MITRETGNKRGIKFTYPINGLIDGFTARQPTRTQHAKGGYQITVGQYNHKAAVNAQKGGVGLLRSLHRVAVEEARPILVYPLAP